jgi:GT2 family glycosyltransferase
MSPSSSEIGVSVIVPTLDREQELLDSLNDLVQQSYRPLEILVIDQSLDRSTSVAQFVAKHYDLIRYHRVTFRGLPEARNYGWHVARYDAIIYIDDDTRFGPTFVTEHLRALQMPGVGLAGGGIDEQSTEPDRRRTGKFNYWTATPSRGFASEREEYVDHAPGGNFSVWRHAIAAVGGVDERLSVGAALYEETDLCLRLKRAGFRIYFNGRARLTHLAVPRGGSRVRSITTYVAGLSHNRSLLVRRHIRWLQRPTAALRLAALVASYAWHYHSSGIVVAALRGAARGFLAGAKPPLVTAVPAHELVMHSRSAKG